MSDPKQPPRLALSRQEAAESLGMSVDSFKRYVLPHIRVVRRNGSRGLRLIPVSELERWLEENAETPIAEEVGAHE